MRWLISLAFVALATLVSSEDAAPALTIRRAFVRPAPLIKLAVQNDAVLPDNPDVVAPVAVAQGIPPYGQYWPRFGGNFYDWGNQAPYWGPRSWGPRNWGPRQRNWRSMRVPYWPRRMGKPARPVRAEVAPKVDVVAEPKPDTETAIDVPVDVAVDAAVDAGVVAAVVPEVEAGVVAAVLPAVQTGLTANAMHNFE